MNAAPRKGISLAEALAEACPWSGDASLLNCPEMGSDAITAIAFYASVIAIGEPTTVERQAALRTAVGRAALLWGCVGG